MSSRKVALCLATFLYKSADIVQVNEQSMRMTRKLEALGADFYKAHRIYERSL